MARPNRVGKLQTVSISLIPYHTHMILNEIFEEDLFTRFKVRRHKIGFKGALEILRIVKSPANDMVPLFRTIARTEVPRDFNFAK